jgi:hypothetical protein
LKGDIWNQSAINTAKMYRFDKFGSILEQPNPQLLAERLHSQVLEQLEMKAWMPVKLWKWNPTQ